MRSYDLACDRGRVPVEASVRLGDPNVNASDPVPVWERQAVGLAVASFEPRSTSGASGS